MAKKTITETTTTTTETTAEAPRPEPRRAPARYWEPTDAADRRVRWVGEGDPPTPSVSLGNLTVNLPDAATQRVGFTAPYAQFLVGAVAGYKFVSPAETPKPESEG